jgi:hypothetical protein
MGLPENVRATYLRRDPETVMQVVLNPTMRLAAAKR